MPAYMVILTEVPDIEAFRDYAVAVGDLIGEFGGEYILRRPKESECLEGDWPDETKCVISRWPSMDAAREFWNSDAYAEVRKLRLGKATVRVRLMEGLE